MTYREEIDSIVDQLLFDKRFDINLEDFQNIVIEGMGGSGIAGLIFSEVYSVKPIVILNSYHCPEFVSKKTLFIALSYSGNTEETLSCAREAKEKGAVVLSITSGGKLSEISDNTIKIPSGYQPRSSLGFLLMPLINTISPGLRKNIDEIIKNIKSIRKNEDEIDSIAKMIYQSGKVPYFVSWSPTASVAYRCKTQFNENSKMLANAGFLSEINHNELVPMGMNHEQDPFIYIAYENSFSDRNSLRLKLTENLSGREITKVKLTGSNAFAQIMYGIYYGDILSYHMALLRGIDPEDVSIIEKLKTELS
ncbi:MAG: bifunctional phosphoglucose/phosphomannose isomerase [Thermoplasmataceae archaeon]